MKKNIWISILEANNLMRSADEVIAFENALASLADRPQDEDLPDLHLILDDRCEQPEVMFGLIHFLESFDVSAQIQAFVTVVPQLMLVASEWTRILHSRILNDDEACRLYRDILHSLNSQEPNFVRQLLEESASYHLNKREPKLELAR
ncbi:Imm30 family immunity protein [Microcoleus sp. D3_18a_C4]|uniref:Imm30 family immunity protein n=1 Tax=Microcoleus sp. D3_18a_C4 TaxID=3055332 RepID=UPI002FD2EF22